MISERQNIAAGYIADGEYQSNVIKNSTDKEVSIIISEAQAQAEEDPGGRRGRVYEDPFRRVQMTRERPITIIISAVWTR